MSIFASLMHGKNQPVNSLQENKTAQNDLVENPSPRCPCVFVLDISSSMGEETVNLLNQGLQHFIQGIKKDEIAACSVEVAVITAGSSITKQLPFTIAMSIEDDKLPIKTKTAFPGHY